MPVAQKRIPALETIKKNLSFITVITIIIYGMYCSSTLAMDKDPLCEALYDHRDESYTD